MILLIDNYDSFTYNVYQYLSQFNNEVLVKRNDKITIDEISELAPEGIVISPGPGRPENARVSLEIIQKLAGQMPILGICLGHQAIGLANDGTIVNADKIMHGKTSQIYHENDHLFQGIPSPFTATRYHSLIIQKENFPHQSLDIIAKTDDDVIMGVRHKVHKNLCGIQFHPESILTDSGMTIIENFSRICQK